MADVSSLANKAYEAYSKGITGFSVEPVREAAKEKRDYERAEKKSIYEITADLDAQAYGTLSDFVEEMFAGIDSKEYYYDSPQMVQKLSALRGKAKAIKETDAILKAATEQFTKNPDGFVYNRKDANGNIVAGSYQDFVKDLDARRQETFETPEQYTQSITDILQNVGSRIDEKQIVPKIEQSIRQTSDEFFKTLRAAQTEALETRKPVSVPIGRGLVQVTDTTDISSFKTQIEDAIMEAYAGPLGQLGALARGRGQDVGDDVTFSRKFISDRMPLTQVDRTIRTELRPSGSGSRGGYGAANIRVEDVSRDVKEAIESADTMPIEKYVNSVGFQSQFDPEEEEFQFYTMKSVGGEIVQDKLFTFRADDADGIERFILDQNQKFLDPGASLDSSERPTVDTQKAKLSQEAKRKEAETKKAVEIKKDLGSISRAWVKGADWKDKRASVRAMVDKYGIEGVGYAKNTLSDYITIDGVEYSDPKEIEEKLMEKIGIEPEKTTSGVGSKYNTPK